MPRYVILEHDHPYLHWDLMLEMGDVLRTWRLAAPPRPGQTVQALASFDHRPMYLEYEGPISGDRGGVVRWDSGTYVMEEESPDRLQLLLQGRRLAGRAMLHRTCGDEWTFSIASQE